MADESAKPSLAATDDIFGKTEEVDPTEAMTTDDLRAAARRLDNQKRQLRSRNARVNHEAEKMKAKLADNKKKIKLNMQLPWLVGTVVEVRRERRSCHYFGLGADSRLAASHAADSRPARGEGRGRHRCVHCRLIGEERSHQDHHTTGE